MIIENIIENEDGSVDCILTLTSNEKQALIQRGFVELLSEWAAKEELRKDVPAILRGDK